MNKNYIVALSALLLVSHVIQAAEADSGMRDPRMRARSEAIRRRNVNGTSMAEMEMMPPAPMPGGRRRPSAMRGRRSEAAPMPARKRAQAAGRKGMRGMETPPPMGEPTAAPVPLSYGGETSHRPAVTQSEVESLQHRISEDMNLLNRKRADAERANSSGDKKTAQKLYQENDALYEKIQANTKKLEELLRAGFMPTQVPPQ